MGSRRVTPGRQAMECAATYARNFGPDTSRNRASSSRVLGPVEREKE